MIGSRPGLRAGLAASVAVAAVLGAAVSVATANDRGADGSPCAEDETPWSSIGEQERAATSLGDAIAMTVAMVPSPPSAEEIAAAAAGADPNAVGESRFDFGTTSATVSRTDDGSFHPGVAFWCPPAAN